MQVAGCLLNYPRQKDNALVIQECADKSMTDQILSVLFFLPSDAFVASARSFNMFKEHVAVGIN